MLAAVREAAAKHGIWVHLGSIALLRDGGEGGKLANRGFVIDGTGAIRARYDKMHLFDVDLPTGESWRESAAYGRGERAVTVDTPLGRLGLAICYDLRFPGLFSALSDAGATLLAVPAAFTRPTGAAHWHILLRARAIEAAAFVIAAAQTGEHADGRATYGHSLVADPWGELLLDMGEAPGLGFAEIDQARVEAARSRVPRAAAPPRHPGRGSLVIVFDLKCARAHVFEAWFGSSAAYEEQRASAMIACPICGDTRVAKAVMAPNVAAKGNRAASARADLRRASARSAEGGGRQDRADAGAHARRLRMGRHGLCRPRPRDARARGGARADPRPGNSGAGARIDRRGRRGRDAAAAGGSPRGPELIPSRRAKGNGHPGESVQARHVGDRARVDRFRAAA